jgi:hypothetical protein
MLSSERLNYVIHPALLPVATDPFHSGIASLLDEVVATKYIALSSHVALAWCYFTRLDEEVEYFWNAPWSLTKAIFFLMRYATPAFISFNTSVQFVPSPSLAFCRGWARGYPWLLYSQICFTEFVLLLRVFALYPRSPWTRRACGATYIGSIVTSLTLGVVVLKDVDSVENPLPEFISGCILSIKDTRIWALFLPSFIFESILFALTMMKVTRAESNERSAPILKSLVRDGTFVYLTSATALLFSSIGSMFEGYVLPATTSGLLIAVSCLGCCHLLFSIKSLQSSFKQAPPIALELSQFYRSAHNIPNGNTTFVKGNTTFVTVEVEDDDRKLVTAAIGTTRVGVWNEAALELRFERTRTGSGSGSALGPIHEFHLDSQEEDLGQMMADVWDPSLAPATSPIDTESLSPTSNPRTSFSASRWPSPRSPPM